MFFGLKQDVDGRVLRAKSNASRGHDDVGRCGQHSHNVMAGFMPAIHVLLHKWTLARATGPPQHFDHWPASSGPTRLISVLSQFAIRTEAWCTQKAQAMDSAAGSSLPEMRVPDGTGGGASRMPPTSGWPSTPISARPATRPGITCCRRPRGSCPAAGPRSLPRPRDPIISGTGMAIPRCRIPTYRADTTRNALGWSRKTTPQEVLAERNQATKDYLNEQDAIRDRTAEAARRAPGAGRGRAEKSAHRRHRPSKARPRSRHPAVRKAKSRSS